MSFALTTEQVKNQTKTVTRRNGWKDLKKGEIIQPVVKCMGLKKGEKQELIGCPIRVLSIEFELLGEMQESDLEKEGFPAMTKNQFIEMYCKANNCFDFHIVTRIEFEYLELEKD